MEYKNFERDFILRSLRVLEQYEEHVPQTVEKYEVTLLLNCLLGLLALPHERSPYSIPDIAVTDLESWGIQAHSIYWGRLPKHLQSNADAKLCDLVHRMRNGIAHLRILAIPDRGEIDCIEFHDANGFQMKMPASSLRAFITNLAHAMTAK